MSSKRLSHAVYQHKRLMISLKRQFSIKSLKFPHFKILHYISSNGYATATDIVRLVGYKGLNETHVPYLINDISFLEKKDSLFNNTMLGELFLNEYEKILRNNARTERITTTRHFFKYEKANKKPCRPLKRKAEALERMAAAKVSMR